MMYQFSFLKRDRNTRKKAPIRNNNNKPKPATEDPAPSGLTGSVGPGILARFRRLFNAVRGFEDNSDTPAIDIFHYTPSQNPEEFLENLRNNPDQCGWDRLASNEVPSVHADDPRPDGHTRFVCISDTHSTHRRLEVPPGDVLIHCGDVSERGLLKEVLDFNLWLGTLPHKLKIVIAGNHDICFDKGIMENLKNSDGLQRFSYQKDIPESIWRDWQSILTNCVYLEDSEITVNGIRIYGSPWQPKFQNMAFNQRRGSEIMKKWDQIPEEIDILLTHGPPAGRLDRVRRGTRAGCVDLLNTVQLRVKPKYHVFGHVHEGYGVDSDGNTVFINCASVDVMRNPSHPPIIFDYPNAMDSVDGVGIAV